LRGPTKILVPPAKSDTDTRDTHEDRGVRKKKIAKLNAININALVCSHYQTVLSWNRLGAKVFAGLRSPAKKNVLSDRPQIGNPVA